MKKHILLALTVCTFLFIETKINAMVWRVNNNGASYVQWTGHQVFDDLAFAVASANSGDTIHLEASPNPYLGAGGGAIHIDKKLIIIGPGYFLGGATGNTNQQVNPNTALISEIFFDANSEYSVITGVQIGTGAGILHIKASNITVQRNYFPGRLYIDNAVTISNIVITQNYFLTQDFIHGAGTSPVINSIISNNHFGGAFGLINNFDGTITQNVFEGGPLNFWGNEFYNNIINYPVDVFIPNNNDTSNIHDNVFTYAAPSFLPTPNSNTFSFPTANLFTTGSSTDGNLHINPLCLPCLNNGVFGYEMGMYGGAAGTEYRLSGVPNIPSIYQLYGNPSIICGDTVNVQIKTRSNN
jgi:hypothetical protein